LSGVVPILSIGTKAEEINKMPPDNERFKGTGVLLLIPMEKRKTAEQAYKWGVVNVETHLKQVWGEFHPFKGINMPSFLHATC